MLRITQYDLSCTGVIELRNQVVQRNLDSRLIAPKGHKLAREAKCTVDRLSPQIRMKYAPLKLLIRPRHQATFCRNPFASKPILRAAPKIPNCAPEVRRQERSS